MTQLFAFLLMLFPLVIIHELGHFLACKIFNIPVTSFAFGFGPKLFGFKFRGTEYCWNLLPLGGYVNYLGDALYDEGALLEGSHFLNKPKWLRFFVLVMGPVFNLILAYVIYSLFFSFNPINKVKYQGEPYTVGYVKPESPEFKAGLHVDDRITAIDGKAIQSVDDLEDDILLSPGKAVQLEVLRAQEPLKIDYKIETDQKEGLGMIGFEPKVLIKIHSVLEDSPAEKAGLQKGDYAIRINGVPVGTYGSSMELINDLIAKAAPEPSTFSLIRAGKELEISVAPVKVKANDAQGKPYERWQIGIGFQYDYTSRQLNPPQALGEAWNQMIYNSTMIFTAVRKLVTAELSPKTMSSPIGVSQFAKDALERGAWFFLLGMAILSLNLGIFNLLPVPVLDGGEIFVILVETIARRDFSMETKHKVKLVGFFFLVGLMLVVMVSDVIKLFF